MASNRRLCSGYRYLKKQLISNLHGLKLGWKMLKNCWRYGSLKFGCRRSSEIFY
ncbi:hypothetical protein FOWG_14754 [Fusarium oxysporum f. sp. lycopersici MN25]|nr:hypothetical protein FOWG_14754 [Fusarium oxysporum f. sp. lycopersici MN25]